MEKFERGRHYLANYKKNSLFVPRWLDSVLRIKSIPFTSWRKLNINIVYDCYNVIYLIVLKDLHKPPSLWLYLKTAAIWDRDHPSAFHLHFQINAHIQQKWTKKRTSSNLHHPLHAEQCIRRIQCWQSHTIL